MAADEPEEKDILEACTGAMGRYHWVICLSLYLIKFPASWHMISHGIMAPKATPIYCSNTTLPVTDSLTSHELKALLAEACSDSCPKVIVSTRYYDNSIVHQYELYCSRGQLTSISQFIVMVGIFVGNFVFGIFADRFGRKLPLVIACGLQPFCGIAVAFSPNIYCFCVFKFLLNVFVGGTMCTSFVLFSEFVGVKWRATMGILFHLPFSLGHLSLAPMAYLFRDWRWFQITLSVPAIFLISYYWFIPESPRWLLAINKPEQAIKELEFVAKRNKLPTEPIRGLVEAHQAKKAERSSAPVHKGNFVSLFKNVPMAFITIGMWTNWFSVACCFYGVAQFMGSIGNNVYLNFALTATIQIPGVLFLFYTLKYWGRKWTLVFGNSLSAIAFVLVEVVPSHTYQIIPATASMFGLGMVFASLYVYSGELFPTVIRNVGLGSSSSLGRVGAMVAAFVADLRRYYDWLPPTVFAVFIGLAALSVLFLPETKDIRLPDTVDEVKHLSSVRKAAAAEKKRLKQEKKDQKAQNKAV